MPIKLGERRELSGKFEEPGERYTRIEHVHYSIFTEHAVFVAMIVLIVLSLVSIFTTVSCCKEFSKMRETWENTVLKKSVIKEYCILVPANGTEKWKDSSNE